MNRLTLEWVEAGQVKRQTITDQQATKNSRPFRIGRDPAQCDLAIGHPTVSKLHIEIFFAPQQQSFYLRSLRETNPPLVDRQRVVQNVVALRQGTTIRLGELDLIVKEVQIAALLPPTVVAVHAVVPPPPAAVHLSSPPAAVVAQSIVELSYGLQCPKCYRISPYEHLETGCAWCGTSLAAAHSVLGVPDRP